MIKPLIKRAEAVAAWIMSIPPLAIVLRAVNRVMQREVMLYAGGASFFALLAVFPAFAVLASVYGMIYSSSDALNQVTRFSEVLPDTVGRFMMIQISQLTTTSNAILTLQGAVALFVALFAASRGSKALIAGLNQIAGHGTLRSVVKFNLLAMGAVLVGVLLIALANVMIIFIPNVIRPAAAFLGFQDADVSVVINEWTVSVLVMGLALALLYRYLMQRGGETSWLGSLIAAAAAAGLWLALSKAFSTYVSTFVNPTAYGSLGAVIVFLLWIYWASYILFFGGALAVEIDNHRSGKYRDDPDSEPHASDIGI